MDWNHIPFLVQTAASKPVSSTWVNDAQGNSFWIDPAERRRAFEVLPAMSNALKRYIKSNGLPNINQPELDQVLALLESVRAEDLENADKSPVGLEGPQAATTYTHKAFIMKKSAFYGALEAEHSAVLLRIYSSGGSLLRQQSYCNHGTCATASSMYAKCYGSFIKGNTNVTTIDQACDQYSSYIFTQAGHGHVCNNDTLQQYLSVKGSANQNWGICDFNWTALLAYYRTAPSCQ